jgi:hypothetical protein
MDDPAGTVTGDCGVYGVIVPVAELFAAVGLTVVLAAGCRCR